MRDPTLSIHRGNRILLRAVVKHGSHANALHGMLVSLVLRTVRAEVVVFAHSAVPSLVHRCQVAVTCVACEVAHVTVRRVVQVPQQHHGRVLAVPQRVELQRGRDHQGHAPVPACHTITCTPGNDCLEPAGGMPTALPSDRFSTAHPAPTSCCSSEQKAWCVSSHCMLSPGMVQCP